VNENLRYTIVLVVIIGRGVFAAKQLEAGEFVCQYYGELVSSKIGSERETLMATGFRFFFHHRGERL